VPRQNIRGSNASIRGLKTHGTHMKRVLFLSIFLGLLLTGGIRDHSANAASSSQKIMTANENKTKNEAEIRGLIDRFAEAFRVKDVDGCMAIFAPEIVSFDIVPPLQAVGAESFVTHWVDFFGSYEGPIHVEFPDIRIVAGEDVAFSYCLHRIAGTLKNGHKTDFWLRWTAGWRKTNGKWLVVHEQVSVPTDLENGRALLDLKP
jgi:ketosteroid isomerase-like protein